MHLLFWIYIWSWPAGSLGRHIQGLGILVEQYWCLTGGFNLEFFWEEMMLNAFSYAYLSFTYPPLLVDVSSGLLLTFRSDCLPLTLNGVVDLLLCIWVQCQYTDCERSSLSLCFAIYLLTLTFDKQNFL